MLSSTSSHRASSTAAHVQASSYGRIVVIKRNGQDSAAFDLTDATYTFGRGVDCDIRIQLLSIAEEHCRIHRDSEGRAVLTNLTPLGTHVNGAVIEQTHLLRNGDIVNIVERSFRFEHQAAAAPAVAATPVAASKATPVPGSRLARQPINAEDAEKSSPAAASTPTKAHQPAAAPATSTDGALMDEAPPAWVEDPAGASIGDSPACSNVAVKSVSVESSPAKVSTPTKDESMTVDAEITASPKLSPRIVRLEESLPECIPNSPLRGEPVVASVAVPVIVQPPLRAASEGRAAAGVQGLASPNAVLSPSAGKEGAVHGEALPFSTPIKSAFQDDDDSPFKNTGASIKTPGKSPSEGMPSFIPMELPKLSLTPSKAAHSPRKMSSPAMAPTGKPAASSEVVASPKRLSELLDVEQPASPKKILGSPMRVVDNSPAAEKRGLGSPQRLSHPNQLGSPARFHAESAFTPSQPTEPSPTRESTKPKSADHNPLSTNVDSPCWSDRMNSCDSCPAGPKTPVQVSDSATASKIMTVPSPFAALSHVERPVSKSPLKTGSPMKTTGIVDSEEREAQAKADGFTSPVKTATPVKVSAPLTHESPMKAATPAKLESPMEIDAEIKHEASPKAVVLMPAEMQVDSSAKDQAAPSPTGAPAPINEHFSVQTELLHTSQSPVKETSSAQSPVKTAVFAKADATPIKAPAQPNQETPKNEMCMPAAQSVEIAPHAQTSRETDIHMTPFKVATPGKVDTPEKSSTLVQADSPMKSNTPVRPSLSSTSPAPVKSATRSSTLLKVASPVNSKTLPEAASPAMSVHSPARAQPSAATHVEEMHSSTKPQNPTPVKGQCSAVDEAHGPVEAYTPAKVQTLVKSPTKVQTPVKSPTKVQTLVKSPTKVQTPVKSPIKVQTPVKSPIKVQTPVKPDSVYSPVAKIAEPALGKTDDAVAPAKATPGKPVDSPSKAADQVTTPSKASTPAKPEVDMKISSPAVVKEAGPIQSSTSTTGTPLESPAKTAIHAKSVSPAVRSSPRGAKSNSFNIPAEAAAPNRLSSPLPAKKQMLSAPSEETVFADDDPPIKVIAPADASAAPDVEMKRAVPAADSGARGAAVDREDNTNDGDAEEEQIMHDFLVSSVDEGSNSKDETRAKVELIGRQAEREVEAENGGAGEDTKPVPATAIAIRTRTTKAATPATTEQPRRTSSRRAAVAVKADTPKLAQTVKKSSSAVKRAVPATAPAGRTRRPAAAKRDDDTTTTGGEDSPTMLAASRRKRAVGEEPAAASGASAKRRAIRK